MVRNAVVILAAEFMRSAGLFIFFFIGSKQANSEMKMASKGMNINRGRQSYQTFPRVISVSSGFPRATLTPSSKRRAHSGGTDAPSDEIPGLRYQPPSKGVVKKFCGEVELFPVEKKKKTEPRKKDEKILYF